MHIQQIALGLINVVGGTLVLASYIHGVLAHPDTRADAWGGVPAGLKPFYFISMLLAAAGYFAFTYFILFRLDPDEVKIGNACSFQLFHAIYALILFPSTLWMPLTFAMLEHPSSALWWAIRVTLAVVGLASLALLAVLLILGPSDSTSLYWLAVAGSAAFCIQTAVLDMLVWPAYFPVKSQNSNR